MKNVWARAKKERKRSMNCGSQEVLGFVYITRNSDNLAEKVNFKKPLGRTLADSGIGYDGEIIELWDFFLLQAE